MDNQKTLILIDGHALAIREYYALERTNMRTSDGTPTWAVYGFFKAIFDLLKNKNLKPDAICVTFDVSHQTFRVEKYEGYKANRESMPDDMQTQMGLIYAGLQAFNIPVYTKEGYEADDVIGTISKRACELGHKVYILTGDQDSFQLIDREGCIKVIIPSKGVLTEYNWDKVYEKLQVYPNQIIDYKSLRGDTSDNIPGIKGIGEKTAAKLLADYGTLENILSHCEEIKPDGVKKKICEGVEMAKMSYFLATIVRDVDIDFDFDGTKINLPDVANVTEFLKRMQFYSFLKNIDSILSSFDKEGLIASAEPPQFDMSSDKPANTSQNGQIQLGLFSEIVREEVNKVEIKNKSKIITDSADLSNLVQTLKTKTLISFRTEANIVNAAEADLCGIAIAYNDDYSFLNGINCADGSSETEVFYIPLKHHIENQLKSEDVISTLRPVFEDDNVKKITHDAKLEYNCLKTVGIETKGIIFDTYLASYVRNPSENHNIEAQALEDLNYVMKGAVSGNAGKDTMLRKFSEMGGIEQMLDYEADILGVSFALLKYWMEHLDERELKLLMQVEVPLTIVLAQMEYDGVSVDTEYLKQLSDDMQKHLQRIENKIYQLAGEGFNISSPKQVGEILFEKLQIQPKKKRGKNKFSTSAEVLEELAQEHEIARLILDYRKYFKLKSTYTDTLPALISDVDGRIHTSYNQAQTVTGRLSSSNPNLQNIPIRSEEGSKIRKAFVPKDRENALILSADYSQIELRLLAHVSQDKNLIEAFKSGEDVHRVTASKVFGVPLSDVTQQMRYKAKAVNFGIVYGQSKYGLAKGLGIDVADAEDFIEKYFQTYPGVKKYMEDMVDFVEKNGYVETVFGRKRYLNAEISSSNAMIREFAKRAAINQPMQGTASDLIKMAMIDFAGKLKDNKLKSKLIMQVHDELVVEVCKDELELVKSLVLEAMELSQPLRVPLLVDVNVGVTWQEK